MSDNRKSNAPSADAGNTQKNPAQWKTGDEPMTGAQRSYLNTLADEAGVEVGDSLTKAEASEKIDQLRDKAVGHREGDGGSNTEKPPQDWKTGDEPMTGAQQSYLKTLSEEAGEAFDENLTKAEASERIDALRERNPRTK